MADSVDDLVRLLRPVIVLIFTAHSIPPDEGQAILDELAQILRVKGGSIPDPAAWLVLALHDAVAEHEKGVLQRHDEESG